VIPRDLTPIEPRVLPPPIPFFLPFSLAFWNLSNRRRPCRLFVFLVLALFSGGLGLPERDVCAEFVLPTSTRAPLCLFPPSSPPRCLGGCSRRAYAAASEKVRPTFFLSFRASVIVRGNPNLEALGQLAQHFNSYFQEQTVGGPYPLQFISLSV